MNTKPRLIFALIALVICLLVGGKTAAIAAKSAPEIGEREIKMGEEAAAEVAKENKLSDNAEDLKRVREMGEKLAAVANLKEVSASYGIAKITPFRYTFDIIEAPDVNAFSVPGGRIYVYRGLLDFVQSDQELAGVLAHEIIHASHHHMVYLIAKQSALNNPMGIVALAAILSGARASDLGNIMMGLQYYQIARLNGYGMEAERDSDRGAIFYMREAGYNPVGLLTFLERLAKRPELVDWGIFRSHPIDAERVAAAKNLITKLGLPINRRETTRAAKAEVKNETINGTEVPSVVINGKTLLLPAPDGNQTAAQRAQDTADRINKMLDQGLQIHEIRVDPNGGGVTAREQPLVIVLDADAKLMGTTPADVSRKAAVAIREVILKQMVDTLH